MLNRLSHDQFYSEYNQTVGVDFGSFYSEVQDFKLKLQIWDTAGDENFRGVTKIFYRSSDLVILCYSITDHQSFDNLKLWLEEVEAQCYGDVQVILVGCKQDLDYEREVSQEEAQEFMSKNS